MRTLDRERTAFSLLEVVIASFIFTVVLGATVTLWVHHDRAQTHTVHRMAAGLIAEETMERCIASGYFLLEDIVDEGPQIKEFLLQEDGQGSPVTYTTTVEVQESPEEDVKVVTVRVEYLEREETRSLTLVHAFYRTV